MQDAKSDVRGPRNGCQNRLLLPQASAQFPSPSHHSQHYTLKTTNCTPPDPLCIRTSLTLLISSSVCAPCSSPTTPTTTRPNVNTLQLHAQSHHVLRLMSIAGIHRNLRRNRRRPRDRLSRATAVTRTTPISAHILAFT